MSDIITFREFTSPHVYNYGDCMILNGVSYQCFKIEGTDGKTGFHADDWKVLTFHPDESISITLQTILTSLQSQIDTQKEEIENLTLLIGTLVFELIEQGIIIENESLINESEKIT